MQAQKYLKYTCKVKRYVTDNLYFVNMPVRRFRLKQMKIENNSRDSEWKLFKESISTIGCF